MKWEKIAIKDISSLIKTGKTPPSKEIKYFEGEINWYTPGDLNGAKYLDKSIRTITNLAVNDKKAVVYPKNSLLIGCIGDIGKVGIAKEECSSNQQLTAIYPKKNTLVDYLYYWVIKNKKLLELNSNNAVVPILNNKKLESIQIPLPPLDEQKKIAQILDAADLHRQKTKQIIQKYEQLTQSLFIDMFGDPVTNPKGWEKVEINKMIKSLNTGVSVNSTDQIFNEEIPCILKTSCVYTGIFRSNEAKVIRKDEYSRMKLSPKKDSIIISRMNTTELVGKSAYIDEDFNNLYLPDRLWQTEKNELDHNVKWLSYAISNDSFQKEIGKISSGTSGSMKNISKKKFLSMLIIYPDPEFQQKFAQQVEAIEIQKKQAEKNLEKAEELFQGLLQKAFKGELTSAKENDVIEKQIIDKKRA